MILLFHFFALLFFFGLPTGNGRTRRPSTLSSLLKKLSLPKGRPVYVLDRNCLTSDSFRPLESSLRHRSADILSYHSDRFKRSDVAPASTCAAALDQAYRQGLRCSRARTGFNSTYLVIDEEYLLAVVPPLGDMVSETHGDGSGESWHAIKITNKSLCVKIKIGGCP